MISFRAIRSWQRLQPINLLDTKSILAGFPPHHQSQFLNEISSASQTAIQQTAWDPNVDGKRKHCGQEDSKFHRIYTCDALAEARHDHQTLLDDLLERDSVWHELPFSQPSEECICTLHATHRPASCSDDTLSRINGLDHRVQCYTDGSCLFPSSATTRFASYAFIIATCPDDAAGRFEAHKRLTTRQPPGTLTPLVISRLPGGRPFTELSYMPWCRFVRDFSTFACTQAQTV